jgi:hypothetical protein
MEITAVIAALDGFAVCSKGYDGMDAKLEAEWMEEQQAGSGCE